MLFFSVFKSIRALFFGRDADVEQEFDFYERTPVERSEIERLLQMNSKNSTVNRLTRDEKRDLKTMDRVRGALYPSDAS